MAVISKLSASLSLDSRAFEARLRTSRKRLSSFGSSIARASKRVAQFGVATAAAAAAGLAVMTRASFASIDSTAKMADVLGLTIDQLRGYQLAAQLAGVENAALQTGFRRLQKNISDARLGLTTAQRAFDALGLSAEALDRLSPDQQFKTVADALATVTSQSDRARVAQDLLGRSGIQLIKLLETGSAGIAAVQERSRMLRGELTRLDASKVEAANDAFSEMKTAISGVVELIAVNVAPDIKSIAESITSSLPAIRAWTENFIAIERNIASVVSNFFGLSDALAASPDTVEKMEDRLIDLERRRDNLVRHFGRTDRVVELETEMKMLKQTLSLQRNFNKTDTGRLQVSMREAASRHAEALRAAQGGAAPDVAGSPDTAADSVSDASDKLKELERMASRVFDGTRTAVERYESTIGDLNTLISEGAIDWDTYGRAVRQAREELESASSHAEDLNDAVKETMSIQREGSGRALGRFESVSSIGPSQEITNPNAGVGAGRNFDAAATNRLNAATLLSVYGTNPDKAVEGENATALLSAIKNLLQKNTMRASYA